MWGDHPQQNEPQPEFCAWCGHLVGHDRLQQATAEGMRGYWICDTTPDCRSFRHALSYNDLAAIRGPVSVPAYNKRTLPIGAEDAIPLENEWG